MKNIKGGTVFAIIFALVLVLRGSVYTVGEWQQAIITQFGKIVGEPVSRPGLHFKLPLVQDVRYFEKRMLNWDGNPDKVPTRDKKFIIVDTSARWLINDPVKFLQTVQNEERALLRIGNILDSKTKNIISKYNLVETVRNTNEIIVEIEKMGKEDDKITGEIAKIKIGRENLAKQIPEASMPEIQTLGIKLIDVLITRIAYEKSVEAKVFERMISERKRIAEKIRSVGKGEEAKIRGKLNLDLKKIQSEAYRKSQTLKGVGEAESIKIYAEAMRLDPGFYEFNRTMDAYRETIPGKTRLILGTSNQFLKFLGKN